MPYQALRREQEGTRGTSLTGHWKATGHFFGKLIWKILYKNLDLNGGCRGWEGWLPLCHPLDPDFCIGCSIWIVRKIARLPSSGQTNWYTSPLSYSFSFPFHVFLSFCLFMFSCSCLFFLCSFSLLCFCHSLIALVLFSFFCIISPFFLAHPHGLTIGTRSPGTLFEKVRP